MASTYCSAAHNRASAIPNDKTGIAVVEGCVKRSIEVHLDKRFLRGLPYWSNCFHLGKYFISQLLHLPYNAEDNRAYILDWLSFSFHYELLSGLPECPSHDCSNLTKIMPLFRKTTLSQVRKSIFSFKVDQSTSIDRQTFFAGPHIRKRLAVVGMYSCVNHQMAILIFGGRFSSQICCKILYDWYL
uniref:Uncharacterized protein n=1 Tax=Gossypium raimondii TaxID=29730 RepID=A0A0D2SFA9_GOSRA|nr:hypothetical protein B456_013G165500 [Gossypium raimondii]